MFDIFNILLIILHLTYQPLFGLVFCSSFRQAAACLCFGWTCWLWSYWVNINLTASLNLLYLLVSQVSTLIQGNRDFQRKMELLLALTTWLHLHTLEVGNWGWDCLAHQIMALWEKGGSTLKVTTSNPMFMVMILQYNHNLVDGTIPA